MKKLKTISTNKFLILILFCCFHFGCTQNEEDKTLNNTTILEGVWWYCDNNGYNEVYFGEDHLDYYFDSGHKKYKYDYEIVGDSLFSNRLDIQTKHKIKFVNEKTIELFFYEDGNILKNTLQRISTLELSSKQFDLRREKSPCKNIRQHFSDIGSLDSLDYIDF
ncbi:hypothetical protein [Reichenbachiella sp. MALMAid0571]|uniref:hypothetical protein n=1 Tax=Reichenbachiella sp. MALMAid0571 TaxID=3143939 RepID=UPI0032E02B6C